MEHTKEAKERQKLSPLKMANKRQLIQILQNVNRAIHEIKTRTETNQLIVQPQLLLKNLDTK